MLVKTIAVAIAAIIVSGCGTIEHRNEIISAEEKGMKDANEQLENARLKDRAQSSPVREINGVWIGAKTVKVAREAELPAIFSEGISFQFPDKPSLLVIAERLGKITGIPTRVTPDALIPFDSFGQGKEKAPVPGAPIPAPPMQGSISGTIPSAFNAAVSSRRFIIDIASPFNGSLSELLDKVSAKYSVGWDYKDGTILFSRIVVRTYQLSTLMDINELSSDISKKGSTETGSSSTGGSTGGGTSSTSNVSSRISAKMDAVKGIESAINGMLTAGIGKFSISSSGIITVTDTREIQEQVKALIDAENKAIGRQVKLRVQVVQVESNVKDDLNIDWTVTLNDIAKKANTLFSPASNALTGVSSGFGQLGVIKNFGSSTASVFIKALSEVGKVRIFRDETYLTLNNRMLSVANTDNYTYPARSAPASGSDNGSTGTVGVEPGQLTTGSFLNLRASIQPNGSVITQLSIDSSIRGPSQKITSNGVALEFPQSLGNQYQIYASAVSGDTVIMAGLDNTEQRTMNRAMDSSLTPLLGGGIEASTSHRKVLILLTPVIVEGVN